MPTSTPTDAPSFSRPYVCIEEVDLAEFVDDTLDHQLTDEQLRQLEGTMVLVKLGTFVARNTDDAKRQAGKSLPITGEPSTLQIVAVPERNYQPGPVNVNPNNEVSVG